MNKPAALTPRHQRLFDRILEHHREDLEMNGDVLMKRRVPAHHYVSNGAAKLLRHRGLPVPTPGQPRDTVGSLEDFILGQDNAALQKIGFGRQIPKDAHYIRSGKPLFFDFRNADLLIEDLVDCGLDVNSAAVGLDFGCSTGRTIRTLGAGLPHMTWIGVDPVPPSIEYAAKRFPKHTWRVNQQAPPMPIDANSVDFAVSKSVWTHFSEAAAIAWLNDIRRILRPGGLAAITVHGWHDLARRVLYNNPNPNYGHLESAKDMSSIEYLELVAEELERDGFQFRPYANTGWQGDLGRIENSSTEDWGLTFMTKAWAEKTLASPGLSLIHRSIARTGHRHDILVFKKTETTEKN